MIPVTCHVGGCPCTHMLYREEYGFRGTVEVKCPRCRRLHLFGSGVPSKEVRCINSFKGRPLGGWCDQLVMKISSDSFGALEYKCPRCKARRSIRIDAPVLVST